MGGVEVTVNGLAGLGDLVLTRTAEASRNRRFGLLVGQGMLIEQAITEINQAIEGYYNIEYVKRVSGHQHLRMPVVDAIYQILHEGVSPSEALASLLGRKPAAE
jgi:glycerol-3-phosphate dehydrogenase (NAD(P)+)